jgi:hypothetical protein
MPRAWRKCFRQLDQLLEPYFSAEQLVPGSSKPGASVSAKQIKYWNCIFLRNNLCQRGHKYARP